jgi:hypothetical protein
MLPFMGQTPVPHSGYRQNQGKSCNHVKTQGRFHDLRKTFAPFSLRSEKIGILYTPEIVGRAPAVIVG